MINDNTAGTMIRGAVVPGVTALRDITRRMLNDRNPDLTLGEIAKALDISRSWLSAFGRGDIPNPGVVTIETLYIYLKRYNR